MQKSVIALVVVAAAIAVLVLNWPEPDQPLPPPPTEAVRSKTPPPAPTARPKEVTTLGIASMANSLNTTETTIEEDFSTLQVLLSQYRKHLNAGNPVGDNAEITAALLGRNAKGLAYLPATGPFIDEEGRLIDRWGTPYFFHAISGEHMQIHSAGPDRKRHTDDDLISEF